MNSLLAHFVNLDPLSPLMCRSCEGTFVILVNLPSFISFQWAQFVNHDHLPSLFEYFFPCVEVIKMVVSDVELKQGSSLLRPIATQVGNFGFVQGLVRDVVPWLDLPSNMP